MNSRRVLITVLAVVSTAGVLHAHLPSKNDARFFMGQRPTGSLTMSRAEAVDTFKVHGEWDPNKTYRGDYTIAKGDTVSYGEFNGKKLWWWAKFYAKGENFKPGFFAPEGGTSPWVLVNSLSAVDDGKVEYQWRGWNGDMQNMSGLKAEIPTWRDGAEGAYSFTHDDIGAMPFEISVKPGWDVAKEFPDIKQCWGIFVEKMNPEDWGHARDMIVEGHEMFNHSMKHTSAADQWQWFYPGQTVPTHDPAIPEAIRGLEVVGTWGDPTQGPDYGPNKEKNYVKVFESPLVAIKSSTYWSQNAPSAEVPGTVLENNHTVITPEVYAKPGVEIIELPTGQKQYVKYTYRDQSGEGNNEGYIAATGATWLEAAQVEKYGGQLWVPNIPYSDAEPVEVNWGNTWTFARGSIVSYKEKVYVVAVDTLKTLPVDEQGVVSNEYTELANYDPSNPILDTTGQYVGPKWSSTTAVPAENWSVEIEKGSPGFVAKVFCVEKWKPAEYKENIQDANKIINENLYEKIVTAGEHFRKGKRCEYYGYPFDAYSEVTHDSLEQNGFVGARGGAKSGRPIPGDFFHPYRIDFDAFYITEPDWDVTKAGGKYIFPDNPHVLLGANQMVDLIVESKGYMIREFHAVCDIPEGEWFDMPVPSEEWPINSSARKRGGWWGGITTDQLREHYQYVQKYIDQRKITVYTVGEVTKYRMTANACENAKITQDGSNYTLTVNIKSSESGLKAKYHDEISVIVSLNEAVEKLGVNYKTVDPEWGISPRRRPRKMDTAGKVWSVSINPFLGAAELVPNGEWNGQGVEYDKTTAVSGAKVISSVKAGFAGINNDNIVLSLPCGTFKAALYSASGRKINSVTVTSSMGKIRTGLSTKGIANGVYFLAVTDLKGAAVMPTAKIAVK